MKILNETFTTLCYTRIEEISFSIDSFEEKIRKYRNILFSIFRELTSNEIQHFSDLNSRILYVSEIYKIDRNLFKEINGMRIFFNNVVHSNNNTSNPEIDIFRSVKWICNTLKYFSEVEIPQILENLFRNSRNLTFSFKPVVFTELVEFLPASIIEVFPPAINKLGNTFSRICIKTDNEDIYYVNLYSKWQNASRYLFKFANIHLFNIKKNVNDEKSFSAGADSLLVLEPDVLLDASSLAECFQQSKPLFLLYFLKKFIYSETSPQMLKGNVVNQVLDDYLSSSEFDFNETVKRCFKTNVFSSIRLQPSELNNIRKNIAETHFPNIIKFSDTLKSKNVSIEPAFISPKFGLQGRLDVLAIDKNDENRKDIIELKSGKPPGNNTWLNNKIQTVAYNLLLESAFSNSRSGVSSIFYSSAAVNPFRNVANDKKSEQELLDLRNEIVYNEIKMASGDCSILNDINPNNFICLPDFISSQVNIFARIYSNQNPLIRKYFNAYTSFIFKEIETLKTGSALSNANFGYNALWRESLEEKIDSATIYFGLKLIAYNEEKDFYTFHIPPTHSISNFREGDICIIYMEVNGKYEPDKQDILKCTIKSLTSSTLELILRKKSQKLFKLQHHINYCLEHDFMESGFNSLLQSIFDFAIFFIVFQFIPIFKRLTGM